MRKDFECERDRWVGIWKKDPESLCVSQKNMKHHAAVQALSSQMMIVYGVNLRHVSSEAIRPWMDLNEKTPAKAEFKRQVFKLIVNAIKEDRNPITGVPFGEDREYGLTEEIVNQIIRYARTGRTAARSREFVKLWKGDLLVADMLIKRIIKNGNSAEEKDLAKQLYYRLHKGPFEVADELHA